MSGESDGAGTVVSVGEGLDTGVDEGWGADVCEAVDSSVTSDVCASGMPTVGEGRTIPAASGAQAGRVSRKSASPIHKNLCLMGVSEKFLALLILVFLWKPAKHGRVLLRAFSATLRRGHAHNDRLPFGGKGVVHVRLAE